MRDVLADLLRWWRQGDAVGMATVVDTWHSSPRPRGAVMLVGPDGAAVGSVSGGCVEGAVYQLALAARDGAEPSVAHFGIADDDAFAAGLTCGGQLDVAVERVDRDTFADLDILAAAIDAHRPVALAKVSPRSEQAVGQRLVVGADFVAGTISSDRLRAAVVDDVRGMLALGQTGTIRYGPDGRRHGATVEVFVTSFVPPPRMIVFGAIDFAAAMTRVGSMLGYRVTVCDARPVFATSQRFPHADEVVVDWPHRYLASTDVDERTVLCVLTHDPKFDVPLLELAITLPVAYIGAMGSRRTHTDRLDRLRAAGADPAALDRISAPIGLDLGARTPEETAVSIAAEIIAARWGGSGQRLRDRADRIHHRPASGSLRSDSLMGRPADGAADDRYRDLRA